LIYAHIAPRLSIFAFCELPRHVVEDGVVWAGADDVMGMKNPALPLDAKHLLLHATLTEGHELEKERTWPQGFALTLQTSGHQFLRTVTKGLRLVITEKLFKGYYPCQALFTGPSEGGVTFKALKKESSSYKRIPFSQKKAAHLDSETLTRLNTQVEFALYRRRAILHGHDKGCPLR
jgi:hypothetical protein